jgi:ADP-heptose:LPS heptosyltransferase
MESWACLADTLIEQGLGVVLTGGPGDEHLLSSIANRTHHPVDFACGQSLEVSAAIFQRCALVVTVDGGAGHLAAAVGTPTVRLYGPAAAAVFGPWPPRSDQRVIVTAALDCVPCGNLETPPCGARRLPACMLALSVDDVVNAVRAQLHRR